MMYKNPASLEMLVRIKQYRGGGGMPQGGPGVPLIELQLALEAKSGYAMSLE